MSSMIAADEQISPEENDEDATKENVEKFARVEKGKISRLR